MKNDLVWVSINTSKYYNILTKLNDIGITLYENKMVHQKLLIKTTYKDYKRIKKYLVTYDVTIISPSGLAKIKKIIKKYLVFTMSSILAILILFLANNMVFKIDVKCANKKIVTLVKEELQNYGLKEMTLKKDHHKIEEIVSKILDNNKDTLEWLEIEYDGLVMNVYVTEKIMFEKEEEYDNCDIISKTDAKITSLNLYRGVTLKEINDYVLKGEVIISGSIMHNEEVKENVCASGEVYGEVWYKVKVEVPFNENYLKYTGKNRYNLSVSIKDDEYEIFKSRIAKKKIEKTTLYSLNDFAINLIKEKEYVMASKKLSVNDAYQKGILLATEKINLKLNKNETILYKKVLKKEVNDSTIYLEVFIVTKEEIGEVKRIEGSDEYGTGIDNENSQ